MIYYCYIKSHCEAPDWEEECEAESKKEACEKFAKMARGDWDAAMMDEFVEPEEFDKNGCDAGGHPNAEVIAKRLNI